MAKFNASGLNMDLLSPVEQMNLMEDVRKRNRLKNSQSSTNTDLIQYPGLGDKSDFFKMSPASQQQYLQDFPELYNHFYPQNILGMPDGTVANVPPPPVSTPIKTNNQSVIPPGLEGTINENKRTPEFYANQYRMYKEGLVPQQNTNTRNGMYSDAEVQQAMIDSNSRKGLQEAIAQEDIRQRDSLPTMTIPTRMNVKTITAPDSYNAQNSRALEAARYSQELANYWASQGNVSTPNKFFRW